MFTDQEGSGSDDAPAHFVTDSGWLNEGNRAGGGAKAGNLSVCLTTLDKMEAVQGVLGLRAPLSAVKPQENAGGKGKRDGPSLDVTFIHAYLSPPNRKVLGITGDNHFYIHFSPPTPDTPASGELVFPLSGTTLSPKIEGYSYADAITITPQDGLTFPHSPLWGVAHRPDLSFLLDGAPPEGVQVDALMFDSGTSGIIGPPEEVRKIFAATHGRVQDVSPKGSVKGVEVVLGKAKCGERLGLGVAIGDRRAMFEGTKGNVKDERRLHASDRSQFEPSGGQGEVGGWLLPWWKTYANFPPGQNLLGFLSNPVLPISLRKRHLHRKLAKRTWGLLHLGLGQTSIGAEQEQPEEEKEEQCGVTVIGSSDVKKVAKNAGDLKIWILGKEFFDSNLAYFNVDKEMVMIVPRTGSLN